MNFLAHLYFADPTPESMAGNLMADFLRGPVDPTLPPAVREGIARHRRVDAFTDAHPCFRRSAARLRPTWGRYSVVLVDMFYDHVLARDWIEWSDEPLADFAARAHEHLEAARPLMPEIMQRAMGRLIAERWLESYATVEGMGTALARLERRFRRPLPRPLVEATADLVLHGPGITEDFDAFFPDLAADVRRGRT